MAKTNLNPGADATLVSVAYRAAVADTPADYSKTFERMADSYEKTMEASSNMWGNIAKVGAAIGGEMMKNAQELTDMVAKGATLNPEDAEMFTNEIYGIKDELSSLGMFSGQFGDRETRLKRAELKIKQQELFADIDNAVANLKVGADAVAAGTFDADLAMRDGEMVNAIIKSNLKNNVTDNKNIARLSRDENGELMYTLYNVENNPDGEVLTDKNGKPRTMTIKQFNESIATNVKDGGAMKTAFGSLTEQESNAGNKALNGTYDPERKQMTLNKLDTLLGDKPVNLKRAMRTPVGYSNTSLYDDLTSKSVLSAELYGALNKVSGNENGELTGGVVDGIEDVDGSGGISASEINYDVLVGNITGLKDAEVSKEFFKQYAVKEMEAAYKYGYSKKPPAPGKTNGTKTDTNPYGFTGKEIRIGPTKGGGSNAYQDRMDVAAATTLIGKIEKGTGFPFGSNNYNYLFDEKTGEGAWHEFKPGEAINKPTETSFIGSAQDLESSIFRTNLPQFQNLKTTVDNSKSLSSSGTVIEEEEGNLNPFSVGKIPQDFINAVGEDDNNVIDYIRGLKIPNLTINKSGNLDTVIISLGEKTNKKVKTFTVDPNIVSDVDRAAEIWNWMKNNYSSGTGNDEYYNLITEDK